MVDCARAAILIPLAHSLLYCVPVKKCSLVETAFLLLVTVSTINMLTIVLNDSPVFPEDDEEDGYQVSLIQSNIINRLQCSIRYSTTDANSKKNVRNIENVNTNRLLDIEENNKMIIAQ
jgi:hypothetical protein